MSAASLARRHWTCMGYKNECTEEGNAVHWPGMPSSSGMPLTPRAPLMITALMITGAVHGQRIDHVDADAATEKLERLH